MLFKGEECNKEESNKKPIYIWNRPRKITQKPEKTWKAVIMLKE